MNADRPVDNAPYFSHVHGGFTIEGWSRAAVQSYWRVPELKVGFDFGAQPWDFMGTPTWFVSHTHLDHVAALPIYVARRRMMKMEPPTIYVPAESLDDVKKLMMIMHRLDRGRQLAEIRGVAPGDEIELSREHVVSVVNTVHTIPSRGFIVSERRRKLKDEFIGLPGEKIKELRLSGVEITREERIPLVAYTGDTSPAGLDNNPAFFEARILITEMSFIRASHRRDKIHKFGHMHLDDFVERSARFKNELIVAAHFSTRYHPNEVRKLLDNRLPPDLKTKLRVWV
ncbi:MAG: metal-dependent hydrolase [Planctomycetaceae bacterium]|nr:metal-dependent hydrolase [Planctomycetaceae bacterium]